MAGSSPVPEPPHVNNDDDDDSELIKYLENMIENAENLSVQMTWMAYDMVVLRTGPELEESLRELEDAYHRCRAAVCGDQEPEVDGGPDRPAATLTDSDMM